MEAERFTRILRTSVAEGALATLMSTLLGGVFLTAFAMRLGASELQIGLLATATSLAHVAQLGGSWAIERLNRRKAICLVATWIARLLWLPILLVPFVGRGMSPVNQVWCIVALLITASLMSSIGGGAWLAWIKELVPANLRLRFLGRRHIFNTGLAFGMSVAGGLFIDAWSRWYPGSLGGFVSVFGFAVSCGLAGMLILQAIPEAPVARPEPVAWHRLLSKPAKDPNFRRLIGFYAAWNFAANLATPFFAVYMLGILDLSFTTVTLLLTLSSTCGLAATRLWTRFGDRFGSRSMVLVATLADAACPLAWLLVTPANLWLLVPIHLLGVVAAPIAMGPNVLSLKLSPSENGSGYLALFNAVTGPLTALGSVVGGLVAGWNASAESAASIEGLRLIFILSAVGRLASLALLRRVREPESTSVRRIVRVFHRAGRRWNMDRRRRLAMNRSLRQAA